MTSAVTGTSERTGEGTGADRPIFIVGCARSGTTLLQLMLHAHPRIAIPPETNYLMRAYDRRVDFGDLSIPANLDLLVEEMMGPETQIEDLGLDLDDIRRSVHAGAPTVGSAHAVVLALYASRWGKPRWGDKRPNYIRRLPVLLKLFPDAQIIHIIRDGRDCVASLKEMPWWTYGTHMAIYKWVEAMRVADWARGNLRDDQYFEFRYEDLVASPRRELMAVCDFLGESFDERMLEHHQVAPDAVPDYKSWHARTHRQIDRKAVRQWRSKLDRAEIRLMERVAGSDLRRYGYRVARGGRFRDPSAEDLAEYKRAEKLQRTRRRRYEVADQAKDEAYPWPVAADPALVREAV